MGPASDRAQALATPGKHLIVLQSDFKSFIAPHTSYDRVVAKFVALKETGNVRKSCSGEASEATRLNSLAISTLRCYEPGHNIGGAEVSIMSTDAVNRQHANSEYS